MKRNKNLPNATWQEHEHGKVLLEQGHDIHHNGMERP